MRYDEILTQTAAALESGRLSQRDLERLLERGERRPASARPGVAGVLAAIGVLLAFMGVALLFTLRWEHLHGSARTLMPFLFPAAALAAAIALHRLRRPVWESELAGTVGFVALALAFLAAAVAFHPHSQALYGLVAGSIGTGVVLAMQLALRNTRLTGWGLSLSLVALTGCGAAYAGLDGHAAGWVIAAQAVAAAAVGGLLFERSREAAASALRTSLLLFYLASLVGQAESGWPDHLSVWHLVISVAVVIAFTLAVSLELDGLVWIGALGALIWLGMCAEVIGSSSGWATALVLVGLGLVGLGMLVAALRKRRIAIR
ncbi:MAG: hypothetical protein QOG33_1938 [Gaiellales bacterium]|jgi:hypothetical protein|nr:hypothetical protein [Gaiellales bacterium]